MAPGPVLDAGGADDAADFMTAHPVGEIEDVVDVVADQENAFGLELLEQFVNLGGFLEAQRRRRLIPDKDALARCLCQGRGGGALQSCRLSQDPGDREMIRWLSIFLLAIPARPCVAAGSSPISISAPLWGRDNRGSNYKAATMIRQRII